MRRVSERAADELTCAEIRARVVYHGALMVQTHSRLPAVRRCVCQRCEGDRVILRAVGLDAE